MNDKDRSRVVYGNRLQNVSIAVLLSCLYRLQMVLLDQSFFLFEDIHRTVEEVVHSQYAATIATRAEKKDTVRAEETQVGADDLNTFEYDKRDKDRNGDIEGEAVLREGERDVSCKGEGEGEEEMKVMEVMVVFYTGLVYELCVTPRMSMEGPRLGLLPPSDEAAVSEERLVQWLLQRLVERNEKEEGRYELLMDSMRLEARKYEVEVAEKVIPSFQDHHLYPSNHNPNNDQSSMKDPDTALVLDLTTSTAIERHDAVVRLLAHIRKSGMDIVFPQDLHDRMLLIFYMSAKCAAPLAHRELMDMILAVQRTRILGEELEMVSKTKVRGILALLKNAHALLATAGQGDSVRLYLGKAVTTFRMFREKHDAFINRCILQQHMFLPLTVKAEVLWQGSDEQSIMDRCEALREFEPLIEDFIMKDQSQSLSQSQSQRLINSQSYSHTPGLSSPSALPGSNSLPFQRPYRSSPYPLYLSSVLPHYSAQIQSPLSTSSRGADLPINHVLGISLAHLSAPKSMTYPTQPPNSFNYPLDIKSDRYTQLNHSLNQSQNQSRSHYLSRSDINLRSYSYTVPPTNQISSFDTYNTSPSSIHPVAQTIEPRNTFTQRSSLHHLNPVRQPSSPSIDTFYLDYQDRFKCSKGRRIFDDRVLHIVASLRLL